MDTDSLGSQLSYVEDLVKKSEREGSPLSIYLLWALIVLVGFPLIDWAPQFVALFWTIAAPAGAILSAWLGWRFSRQLGQVNRDLGVRHALHWGAMLVAMFALVPLGATGIAEWHVVHKVILLVLALGYFLAGVHLERPMAWVGLLIMGAYGTLFYISAFGWTIVGIALAAGLAIAGIVGGRNRAA